MNSKSAFRNLRICYLNSDPKVILREKVHLESLLKQIATIDLIEVSSIDDKQLNPCDLIILSATHIPSEEFPRWLEGLHRRLKSQRSIKIPAMIIADLPFKTLNKFLKDIVGYNWYFDIFSMKESDSLPIRVANLLRIHDHLHELSRYDETLSNLEEQVSKVKHELTELRKG